MVKMVPPPLADLDMDLKVSYGPPQEEISSWHTVSARRESLLHIATEHQVPVARLIEFNFPGSVTNGRINPDIVNWYLFHHERFRCRDTTRDGLNYMFRSGHKVAIPYLGKVGLGIPEIARSKNTSFQIKMLYAVNAGKGVAFDYIVFQIWDVKAGLCSYYTYGGSGISFSLKSPLSGTTEGDWNDFSVTKPMAVNQFTGFARFTTIGAGPFSGNYLHFMHLPNGTQTIPSPLPINTGFTIVPGGGSSIGTMTLEMRGTIDGLIPYKGP
jgi:hypothetical protein